jgi:ketosteroid isomerase-like protein
MGQAREVLDGITAAALSGDRAAIQRLYAADAVVETPDVPRIEGPAAIADYHLALSHAFPDGTFVARSSFELGDVAIDEGWFEGTHTEVFSTPDGDIPPTGKRVRARACDILEARDGRCVSHRFYYDQLEFMVQLGLTEPAAAVLGSLPQPRAAAEGTVKQPTAG